VSQLLLVPRTLGDVQDIGQHGVVARLGKKLPRVTVGLAETLADTL
jgi:hypothetical protein